MCVHVYMRADQSQLVEAASKAEDVIAAAMDNHARQVPRTEPKHGVENTKKR